MLSIPCWGTVDRVPQLEAPFIQLNKVNAVPVPVVLLMWSVQPNTEAASDKWDASTPAEQNGESLLEFLHRGWGWHLKRPNSGTEFSMWGFISARFLIDCSTVGQSRGRLSVRFSLLVMTLQIPWTFFDFGLQIKCTNFLLPSLFFAETVKSPKHRRREPSCPPVSSRLGHTLP